MVAEGLRVRGFVKLRLINARTRRVEYESGWMKNLVTTEGFTNFIIGSIGAIAGAKQWTHMALSTQSTSPTVGQTSMTGEFGGRKATTNTFESPSYLQAVAQWGTSEANGSLINAVGMYGDSAGGNISCISIVASPQTKTSSQILEVTYQWRFSNL